MGFYNIFRIIRLLLKDIFGYKTFRKILIILLIIFFLCFIYTKVFATNDFSISYTLNGKTKTLSVDDEFLDYEYIFLYASGSSSNNHGEINFIASNVAPTFEYSSSVNVYRIWFNLSTGDELYIGGSSGNIGSYANNYTFTKQNTTYHSNQGSYYLNITINNTNYYYGYSRNYSYLSTFDVVINNQTIFATNYSTYINPTLGNSQSDLENLNFSNFIINANSYTEEIENNDGTLYMLFYNKSLDKTSVDYLYPIKEKGFTKGSIYTDYENSTSSNMVFSFPIFMSGVFFNVGSTYQIRFAKQNYNTEYGIMTYEYLGEPYTFTISSNVTQDYINQLNQQTATSSDSESTQELQSSINQQTQSINDINNSINDSNVDNSSINLPTDNTQDITQNGVDNIFQTIYNSFTSGTAQDIVFPIPNTNKNITLQANYTYNMLQNSNATWIINIIQAFYWYIISRYIIVDIMQKIRKIKQGDLEDIQNSNIKEDML